MKILRWIAVGVFALVGFGLAVSVAARFSDGPINYFHGGALSGIYAIEPVSDWSTITADGSTIELETRPDDPYSVTIEARIRAGTLYSWSAWEHNWNTNVLADPRVVVRVAGTLYRLSAVRVEDRVELRRLHHAGPTDGEEFTGVSFRFDFRPE